MSLEVRHLPLHPNSVEMLLEQLPHTLSECPDSYDLVSIRVRIQVLLILCGLEVEPAVIGPELNRVPAAPGASTRSST